MDRRTFVTTTVAAAASSILLRDAQAQPVPKAQNVVLIHGLFADGSSWSRVIARLQRFMAKRMTAKTIEVEASHVSLISQPDAITNLILAAAGQA